jgi:peroxiredoxin
VLYHGAVRGTDMTLRQSVLIDKEGTVRWIERQVDVGYHGKDVLSKMRELGLIP